MEAQNSATRPVPNLQARRVIPAPAPPRPQAVVVVDSTVLMAFGRGGAMRQLEAFLGSSWRITDDVLSEVERHASRNPPVGGLAQRLRAADSPSIVYLSEAAQRRAEGYHAEMRGKGDHRNEHWGECATVAWAVDDAAGRRVVVATDDRDGKDLARAARLGVTDSQSILIKMVERGFIEKNHALRVIRQGIFENKRGAWPQATQRVTDAVVIS